jgi:hypothetical protein
MPEFVSKIASPFVPRSFEMQNGSSEIFEWLAKKIKMENEWVWSGFDFLQQHSTGEDGIRFGMLKELPLEGKRFVLHILTTFVRIVMFQWAGKEQRLSRFWSQGRIRAILTLFGPSACSLS